MVTEGSKLQVPCNADEASIAPAGSFSCDADISICLVSDLCVLELLNDIRLGLSWWLVLPLLFVDRFCLSWLVALLLSWLVSLRLSLLGDLLLALNVLRLLDIRFPVVVLGLKILLLSCCLSSA